MISVKIKEIANGFVLELFDMEGPTELDKTIFCESFEKALEELQVWFKKEKETQQ